MRCHFYCHHPCAILFLSDFSVNTLLFSSQQSLFFLIPDLHCYFKYLGAKERVFEKTGENPTSRRIIFTVHAFFISCSIFVLHYFTCYIISILFNFHHQERMQASFGAMLPTQFTSGECHISGVIQSLTEDSSVSSAAVLLPFSSSSYFK